MKTITEKHYESYITNDGYLVSEWFSSPLKVKSELNKVRQNAKH